MLNDGQVGKSQSAIPIFSSRSLAAAMCRCTSGGSPGMRTMRLVRVFIRNVSVKARSPFRGFRSALLVSVLPVRELFAVQLLPDCLARPHQGVVAAVNQHFRNQRAAIVTRSHHSAIGAGIANHEKFTSW